MTEVAKYRLNAGVVVFNSERKVLMCRRVDSPKGRPRWQFPQGGIDAGETPQKAARRELFEETGIVSARLVLTLPEPIRYTYPPRICREIEAKGYGNIGQEQYWSLFYFFGDEAEINFDRHPEEIEFDAFKWFDISEAPKRIWAFKRPSYEKVAAAFGGVIRNSSCESLQSLP